MDLINKVVELKDGRVGRVAFEMERGDFLLASGKGGQISSFERKDVLKLREDKLN